MQSFIRRKNIDIYRKRLAATTDEAERRVLVKLLAEEQAKEPSPKPRRQDDG